MDPVTNPSRRKFLRSAGQTVLLASAATLVTDTAASADTPPVKIPEPPSKKLGFAIVGLGHLALEEILPAFSQCEHCKPVALVSGHRDKADKTAAHYGIDPKNVYRYDKYDDLAHNDAVDVIYIVLPNSMHAEYTIRGLQAGKHVLCEKPMAANVKECEAMIATQKKSGRKLMIAYRLHYEPHHEAAIEMARKKEFGDVVLLEAQNNQRTELPNIRLQKSTAGGPLGDVGVYCINAARYIIGEEPVAAMGMQHQPTGDDRFKEVPASVTFQLKFPSGALAVCGASFDTQVSRRMRVNCQQGWFEIDPAFGYTDLKLRSNDGKLTAEHMIPNVDHFAHEMDDFAKCLMENRDPRTPGEEGLADMKVMASIEASIASGHIEKV